MRKWPEFLRPHKDPWSIMGYLALGKLVSELLGRIFDMRDTIELVQRFGPRVWDFFGTTLGLITLLLVSVVAIAWSNHKYGGSILKPEPRGVKAKGLKKNEQLGMKYQSIVNSDAASNIVVLTTELASGRGIGWHGLKEPGDPYLTFSLEAVNASEHVLSMQSLKCTGQIRLDSHDLAGPPNIKGNIVLRTDGERNRTDAKRGDHFTMEIKQKLYPKMVEEIRNKGEQKVVFSFSGLTISVNAINPITSESRDWHMSFVSRAWAGNCEMRVPLGL